MWIDTKGSTITSWKSLQLQQKARKQQNTVVHIEKKTVWESTQKRDTYATLCKIPPQHSADISYSNEYYGTVEWYFTFNMIKVS